MAESFVNLLHGKLQDFLAFAQGHKHYPHAEHHYHNNSSLKASIFVVFAAFLAMVFVKNLLRTWKAIKLYVLARPMQLGKPVNKFGGAWAVVTGASDGIGKEYARQLAQRGLKVVLVARNREKLDAVAKQIQAETPNSTTQVLVIDFATASLEDYRQLEEQLKNLENDGGIGILVNNVGTAFEIITRYHEYPQADEAIIKMINVNITPAALISRMVLPFMLKRRNGAIINISSIVGVFRPIGLLVVYPQTKRFLRALSAGLADEYEADGITVQSVCPGLVVTNLSQPMMEQGQQLSQAMSIDTKSCVSWALAQLGLARETYGHPKHFLTVLISLYLVPWWVQKLALNSKRYGGQKLEAYVLSKKKAI